MNNKTELEQRIDSYIQEYISRNHAAQIAKEVLDAAGIGVKPLLDHITLRTKNIDQRAQEFLPLGYTPAETLEYSDWHAKVYRAPGFPALFVDQAYDDDRGATSVIPRWVDQFSDRTLHHIAILVEDIETAMHHLWVWNFRDQFWAKKETSFDKFSVPRNRLMARRFPSLNSSNAMQATRASLHHKPMPSCNRR